MRFRPEILVLLLIVAFIAVMMTLSHRDTPETGDWNVVRSSYRTLPHGYKALYLTLDRLNLPVRRHLRPYMMLPERGLLIVADVHKKAVNEYEITQLKKWIAAGNHALVLAEYHPGLFLPGDGAERLFDLDDFIGKPGSAGKPVAHTPENIDAGMIATEAAALVPSFLTARAPALTVKTTHRFAHDSAPAIELAGEKVGATLLYADEVGSVVAYSPLGEGGIVWCTSPWSFSNEGIAEGYNLEFILALVGLQPGAPIIFDEYHHGHGTRLNLWTVAPTLTKLGILQVAVAVVLLLITLSWRFGPIQLPVEERFSRSRAEYLTSMAGLLERLHATHVVAQRLRLRVGRVLGQRLGLSAHASLREIAEANVQHPMVDHALLLRICREFEFLEREPRPDEETLLDLVRNVERLLSMRKVK